YRRLQNSRDETLAGVAGKAVKEVAYHRDHATQWTLRLGDGTDESHRRMQAGVERVWPYVDEMFRSDPLEQTLAADGIAVDVAALRPAWDEYVTAVLREATLIRPDIWTAPGGGRQGLHTERLGDLLAGMQHMARSHPGGRGGEGDGRGADPRGVRASGRSRDPGALDRRPRHSPGRQARQRRAGAGDDHANVLRLPGDGRYPPRYRRRLRAPRLAPGGGADRALAGVDDGLDVGRRQAEAAGVRHRAARTAQ